MQFSVDLSITKAMMDKLSKGKPWSGKIVATVTPNDPQSNSVAQAKAFEYSEDAKSIIAVWNLHPVVLEQADQSWGGAKNKPTSTSDPSLLAPMKSALKLFETSAIIDYVNQYLECCALGEHIHNDRNVAYKTLTGLLQRLIKVAKTKEAAWWMTEKKKVAIADPDPELTERILRLYARTFLNKDEYPEPIKARDHVAFIKFGEVIKDYSGRFPVTEEWLITTAFKCAKDTYQKTIYPAHLANHNFLTIVWPQKIVSMFGATTSTM